MAAPTPTARTLPAGRMLKNGYQCLITCALDPDIEFWEKTVKPPGLDGGEAIDITTQHNIDDRTKAPRGLVEQTESEVTFAYDPVFKTRFRAIVNRETTFTNRYPDGSTEAYFGFARSIDFEPLEEGTQPEGTMMITPTAMDVTNNAEAPEAIASVAGT